MDLHEQQRLKGWLDAARRAQEGLEENEESSRPDGVLNLVDRQRRSRHLRSLAEMIRRAPAERLRSKRSRWVAMCSAAAAVLAVGVGVATLSAGSGADRVAGVEDVQVGPEARANLRQVFGKVIATHVSGENRLVGADTPLAVGDELSTAAEAFASLEAGKARVDLSAATTLRLTELDASTQIFHLQAGRVDISVPRVPGEQRLVRVTTADATVTVHGTVFSVETRVDESGPITTVGVTRGLVSVKRNGANAAPDTSAANTGGEVMLQPGQSWNSRVGSLAALAVAPTAVASTAVPSTAVPPKPSDEAQSAPRSVNVRRGVAKSLARDPAPNEEATQGPSAEEKSALAEQNRIFEAAMRARDRGDDRAAMRQLRVLLKAHPDSPLKSTAQAELAQAARRLGER